MCVWVRESRPLLPGDKNSSSFKTHLIVLTNFHMFNPSSPNLQSRVFAPFFAGVTNQTHSQGAPHSSGLPPLFSNDNTNESELYPPKCVQWGEKKSEQNKCRVDGRLTFFQP